MPTKRDAALVAVALALLVTVVVAGALAVGAFADLDFSVID